MITIDKLSLQVCGLSEEEGRKLARLVAEDLALVSLPPGCPESVDGVGVNVTQPTSAPAQTISQLIVADVLRQLQRTL